MIVDGFLTFVLIGFLMFFFFFSLGFKPVAFGNFWCFFDTKMASY